MLVSSGLSASLRMLAEPCSSGTTKELSVYRRSARLYSSSPMAAPWPCYALTVFTEDVAFEGGAGVAGAAQDPTAA